MSTSPKTEETEVPAVSMTAGTLFVAQINLWLFFSKIPSIEFNQQFLYNTTIT